MNSKSSSSLIIEKDNKSVFDRLYNESKILKDKRKKEKLKYESGITKELFVPNLKSNEKSDKNLCSYFNLSQGLRLYSVHLNNFRDKEKEIINSKSEITNKSTSSNSYSYLAYSDFKVKRSQRMSSTKSLTQKECDDISSRIYERGVIFKQNKQNTIVSTIMDNNSKEQIFPFHPDISKSQNDLYSVPKKPEDRIKLWAKVKQDKMEKVNKDIENKNNNSKFKPVINATIMKDDNDFISCRKNDIAKYVQKRRGVLRSQSNESLIDSKKYCYCNRMNVSVREIRNVSIETTDRPSDKKIRKNLSYFRLESPKKVLNQRKQLGTSTFFDRLFLES